eukprot:m.410716 g.410716  ORF g.410716 m.410716 type:complete len:110 (-) comp28470_c0_seq1:2590-2919(-)
MLSFTLLNHSTEVRSASAMSHLVVVATVTVCTVTTFSTERVTRKWENVSHTPGRFSTQTASCDSGVRSLQQLVKSVSLTTTPTAPWVRHSLVSFTSLRPSQAQHQANQQ